MVRGPGSLPTLAAKDADLGRGLEGALARHGAAVVREVDVADDEALLEVVGMVAVPSSVGNGGELIFAVTPKEEPSDRSGGRGAFELHTDSTFLPAPHDVIALGCQIAAPDSGASLVVRVDDVCERIADRGDGGSLDALRESAYPFIVEAPAGEPAAALLSILGDGATGVTVRYRQDVTERLRDAGVALEHRAAEALATFERTLAEEDLVARFMLRPGDVLLVDNRRALHGRESVVESSPRLMRRVKAFDPPMR